MDELYPTPTRLDLLREVQAGRVFRDAIGDDYISGDRKINARIAELEQAGWVYRLASGADWLLTDEGRKVLADA